MSFNHTGKTHGLIVVGATEPCRGPEIRVSWNIGGPQGERGPQGPQGDKGDTGHDGTMAEEREEQPAV
jgi:hypothetical protein